ncbi:MAG: glutamyl-tRNA reductase [Phycisphaeraceae bacterium]
MRVLMLGMNHRTAPVELRERLALSGAALDDAIDRFRALYPLCEFVALSTCNRTEFYLARPVHEPPSFAELTDFLVALHGVDRGVLQAATIHRENDQAVAQLFRVACGLESMVLGEPQILGQVKRAYEQAALRQAVGPVLHRVFQQAIALAKQVRHSTGIDHGRVSVGSVACDFARQIFQRFDDKTVLAIGAGEMAKLTLRHLAKLRPGKLWLTNRTLARATALAQQLGLTADLGGARSFDDLDNLLIEADIVLTSTAAVEPIITARQFKRLLRRRRSRPLFIVDIAVPRDVEPEVGTLSNIYLYNIDDLQRVVAQTHEDRTGQVEQANAMVLQAMRACMTEIQNRDIGKLIRALRQKLHDVGEAELQRTTRKLAALSQAQLQAALPELLEEHTHRVLNKILHLPLSQLDRSAADPERSGLGFHAAALRRLFALEEEGNLQEGVGSRETEVRSQEAEVSSQRRKA